MFLYPSPVRAYVIGACNGRCWEKRSGTTSKSTSYLVVGYRISFAGPLHLPDGSESVVLITISRFQYLLESKNKFSIDVEDHWGRPLLCVGYEADDGAPNSLILFYTLLEG